MAIKPCTACGTLLIRPPAHLRGANVFCNRECRKAYHRPLIECPGCGSRTPRDPKNPGRKHCSWACYKASRHISVACFMCGEIFDTYVSEQRKRQDRGHVTCCSAACRNVYTSLLLGGNGTWTPGGQYSPKKLSSWRWRQTRAAYLATVGDICEGCSSSPIEHVHHLHPRALGGPLYDFDNLMAVCRDCHDNMHAQLLAGAFWCSFEGVEFDAALAGGNQR